jgi:hypothetical protein
VRGYNLVEEYTSSSLRQGPPSPTTAITLRMTWSSLPVGWLVGWLVGSVGWVVGVVGVVGWDWLVTII